MIEQNKLTPNKVNNLIENFSSIYIDLVEVDEKIHKILEEKGIFMDYKEGVFRGYLDPFISGKEEFNYEKIVNKVISLKENANFNLSSKNQSIDDQVALSESKLTTQINDSNLKSQKDMKDYFNEVLSEVKSAVDSEQKHIANLKSVLDTYVDKGDLFKIESTLNELNKVVDITYTVDVSFIYRNSMKMMTGLMFVKNEFTDKLLTPYISNLMNSLDGVKVMPVTRTRKERRNAKPQAPPEGTTYVGPLSSKAAAHILVAQNNIKYDVK